jgi:rare lipoprotein A (peptidoglycan hydrolase)
VILQDELQFQHTERGGDSERWIVCDDIIAGTLLGMHRLWREKKDANQTTFAAPNRVLAGPEPEEPPGAVPSVPQRGHSKLDGWTQVGVASWYAVQRGGRRTASGEPYNGLALTAAHRTLPFQRIALCLSSR